VSRLGVFVIAAATGGALAIAAGWFYFVRDVAEPASVDEAVKSFREDTETTPSGPSPVPPGVYVYATEGFEKTDALTGVTHRYPRRTSLTVTKDSCGVRMRWDVLEGRSTDWTFCVGPEGWALETQDERHTFFGRTERTTYTCEDTPFRPAGDRPGTTFRISCTTGSAEERGTGRVVGRKTLRVGGKEVATVQLRKSTFFTGEIRGTTTHDVWLARESGVPVRIVMVSKTTNDSALGDVHYEEEVELALRSLRPRR
jgi:hypothetical protein